MPITPFLFGPGAAINAVAPKHVSFLAFCAANVLIDIELLYYMLTGQYPLHSFFHTYIGAGLITQATVLIFLAALKLDLRFSLPDLLQWQSLSSRAFQLGAAIGSYSHIVSDSVMHADITPLFPFSETNVIYQLIPLSKLQFFCVYSAILGLLILGIRQLLKARHTA